LQRDEKERGVDVARRRTWCRSHENRSDLVGEHAAGDVGQLALACLFGGIWIADTYFLNYTTLLNEYVPGGPRVLAGVVLLVLALYLARQGLSIVFGGERETSGVLRKSVFGIVRHPVYLSEILLYLGCLMFSMSLAAAAVWVAAIAFLHYISRYEEKLLLARFGEEYAQYMREVGMWIPRFRRR
jgi:protein-S-isoprenylcysteine O-methyltransferase Ste14